MAGKTGNLLVALLLPLAVCAFFVIVIILAFQWEGSDMATNLATAGQQQFYTNNQQPSTTKTPVNGQTTYTSADYGFQIEYPNQADAPSQVYNTSPVTMGSSGLSIQQLHVQNGAFYDSTMTNKNDTCLIPAGSGANSVFFSYKDTQSIAGQTAYHYANYPNPNARFCDNPAGCFYYDIYRVAQNGACYEIVYEHQGGSTDAIPSDISQMISSIQFTH